MPIALVTVGSTQFPELIDAVLQPQFLAELHSQGLTKLVIQHGSTPISSNYPVGDLQIDMFDYVPDLTPFMQAADLIIAHAGAGTAIEALRTGKRLIMVPNQRLADNHQLELANRLAASRHCLAGPPSRLSQLLEDARNALFQPLPPPNHRTINSIFAL